MQKLNNAVKRCAIGMIGAVFVSGLPLSEWLSAILVGGVIIVAAFAPIETFKLDK